MQISEIISTSGLILTAFIAVGGWLWQRWQERTSVRVAIVSEIIALREIAISRSYLEGLKEAGEELKNDEKECAPVQLQVQVPSHYCRVYIANLGKLGYLSPADAKLVVMFYQYIDSVVVDITKGGIIYEGTNDCTAFLEAARILELALDIAQELRDKYMKNN